MNSSAVTCTVTCINYPYSYDLVSFNRPDALAFAVIGRHVLAPVQESAWKFSATKVLLRTPELESRSSHSERRMAVRARTPSRASLGHNMIPSI
jgi:hypothetical protein